MIMERLLRIEVNKDNVYDVVKKLEDKGFTWDYSISCKPTDEIPYDTTFIYVYADKTITCSKVKRYEANKYMTADEFLKNDNVNHPSHYQGKNECIDVMIAMFGIEAVKHFCMCNAYKYRFRADKKNGKEDIDKAEWYESKLIELGGVDNVEN